jgi:hypothetical protein
MSSEISLPVIMPIEQNSRVTISTSEESKKMTKDDLVKKA